MVSAALFGECSGIEYDENNWFGESRDIAAELSLCRGAGIKQTNGIGGTK
jgi:hypothetical protein